MASLSEFERGAMAVLDLLKEEEGERSRALEAAGRDIGASCAIVNGVALSLQDLRSSVESRVLRLLVERKAQ